MDYQCLELLARSYRSPKGAMSEIINLQAILNLPKGTEHFLSDLHGEADTFLHILKNASGVIRTKIDMIFDYVLTARQKDDLAALIYYPEERLPIVKREEKDMDEWYRQTLLKLIEVLKVVASKYTRSKVRKALPRDYMYVIDELINMSHQSINKQNYYDNIISSIIELNDADSFVVAMCELIQRLAIDHLHIVGDIFDRGDGADVIVDRLMRYHSLDIQWGNHDLLWIGAACGNAACIANIIRINCTYRNLQILESRYGINLRPLSSYAAKRYADDPCETFRIDDTYNTDVPFDGNDSLAKLNKAITVIQLKLENHAAREPYVFKNTIKATLSSRYMIYTGLTVLVFLIYHLYQYTLRVGYDPAQFTTFISDGTVETFDVYKMIVTGFSNVWCSAFYILAVLMLFSHLRHGVQSIFQTVGVDSRKIRPFYNFIAIAYGAIICLGFISVPVSVLLGIIK